MFGGLAFLLHGNMACGVRGDDLIVRVAADAADAALGEPGARSFDLTGRPMKGWLLVDADGHAEDDGLCRWVDRASPTPVRCRPSNASATSPMCTRVVHAPLRMDVFETVAGYRP
ncbi:MAG TPA: TfoX/Sxy family protein, partial [Actinomycetes bacterium]|nr:TfoX/Sxy family protein [Actinomycetes bacterium]